MISQEQCYNTATEKEHHSRLATFLVALQRRNIDFRAHRASSKYSCVNS